MAAIVIIIVVVLTLGWGVQMSVFVAAIVSVVAVLLMGAKWDDIRKAGLEMISPEAIVPPAFILCSITSGCASVSCGCVAAMGLALYGIGVNLGISTGVIAAAFPPPTTAVRL